MEFAINRERLLRRFLAMAAIDSETYHERGMADYLTAELTRLGLSPVEDDTATRTGCTAGNLFARFPGDAGQGTILLSGHMDTVAPGNGKNIIVEPEGRIHSDGTTVLGSDDLAGVASILEAVETVLEHNLPHVDAELLFSTAEEAYTVGASAFDYSQLRATSAYTFDLSGPVGGAAYAAPTILSFEIAVQGKAAHAGFAPEEGASAVVAASQLIAALPWGRLDADTTANVGTVFGGVATNIVPERCVLTGEIRSLKHEKAMAALAAIEAQAAKQSEGDVSIAVTYQEGVHAYQTDRDSACVRRFVQAAESSGLTPELSITLGGSDNNVFCQQGMEGLVVACAMNQVHTTEEYTTLDELERSARLALHLLIDGAKPA